MHYVRTSTEHELSMYVMLIFDCKYGRTYRLMLTVITAGVIFWSLTSRGQQLHFKWNIFILHKCQTVVVTVPLLQQRWCVASNCPMGISHKHKCTGLETGTHAHTHTNTPVNIQHALVCQQLSPPLITYIHISSSPSPAPPSNSTHRASPDVVACP